jgi:hypothetical protein
MLNLLQAAMEGVVRLKPLIGIQLQGKKISKDIFDI